jgi:hypothetical protein
MLDSVLSSYEDSLQLEASVASLPNPQPTALKKPWTWWVGLVITVVIAVHDYIQENPRTATGGGTSGAGGNGSGGGKWVIRLLEKASALGLSSRGDFGAGSADPEAVRKGLASLSVGEGRGRKEAGARLAAFYGDCGCTPTPIFLGKHCKDTLLGGGFNQAQLNVVEETYTSFKRVLASHARGLGLQETDIELSARAGATGCLWSNDPLESITGPVLFAISHLPKE